MSQSHVQIVLTSTDGMQEVLSGGERQVCQRAEEIIRNWYATGGGISLAIQVLNAQVRKRVQLYLLGLTAELQKEAHAARRG